MLTSAGSLPKSVFALLCERVLSLNNYNSEKIINGNDLDNILIIIEYINSILDTFTFVLNITNIQNIDSMSLVELQKILQKHKGLYFILEYTTDLKNKDYL